MMNWKDKTNFIGDNLHIMRGMNSDSVDLIYLDSPRNSNRNYAAPIGSQVAGAAFKDTWTLSDVDEAEHGELAEQAPSLHSGIQAAREVYGKGMQSYLIMTSTRLTTIMPLPLSSAAKPTVCFRAYHRRLPYYPFHRHLSQPPLSHTYQKRIPHCLLFRQFLIIICLSKIDSFFA